MSAIIVAGMLALASTGSMGPPALHAPPATTVTLFSLIPRTFCGSPQRGQPTSAKTEASTTGGTTVATAKTSTHSHARVGDWIEARGVHGRAARRGEIIELLGREGHEHYRVRWDDQHESIVYPADGVIVIPSKRRRR